MINFFKRPPDFIVGHPSAPYMLRWWLIPRNRFFNIYLHKFLRSDEDRALHDHPWASLGMILKGEYIEHMPRYPHWWKVHGHRQTITKVRRAWRPVFRRSTDIHRIELMKEWKPFIPRWGWSMAEEKPVWTLFITGPKLREWGFWCPFGFRHHKDFVSTTEVGNHVGRGCES